MILVVADHEATRAQVARMVRGIGYQVRTARDGPNALRCVRRFGSELRLLLTELVMPRMDGAELGERARELVPRLEVVLMSDPPRGETAELVRGYPEFPLLEKPVTFGALYDTLTGLIGVPAGPEPKERPRRPARYRTRDRGVVE
jgi:CheY-like chemotaxis protein